jgi:mycothiol synthase
MNFEPESSFMNFEPESGFIKIEHRSKNQFTPDFIRGVVVHINRHRLETHPDDPARDPEEMVAQLAHIPPFLDLETWSVPDQNGVGAHATLQILNMDTNQHLVQLELVVESHLRRQGIGTKLLRLAAQHSQKLGRTLLITDSTDRVAAGQPFLEKYGLTQGLVNHVNQLKLTELPDGLLQTWTTRQPDEYNLEIWHGDVPESDLVAYAELSNVMNTAPTDDLDIEDFHFTAEMLRQQEAMRKAGNRDALTAVVRHTSGALVGLNELGWSNSRPGIVNQGGTGVLPEHRNHGLGRWLKAANLQRLLELNPEAKFIRTGNADSNAPMLKINTEMGFKPYIASIAWQGNITTILEKMGAI